MADVDLDRALVFGQVAQEYARWRPTYPDEAVTWLIGEAVKVVDLGAGTGQLTGQMLARGLEVHAVERDPRMLAVLQEQFPTVRGYASGADQIPLPDNSVDAVLSAGAWHWFPVEATMAEVRRVLRPGGWLGLVWNVVKPMRPWEFQLAGIDPDKKGLDERAKDSDDDAPFPATETSIETFPWDWHLTPEHFRGYLATNSAVIRLDAQAREAKLDDSQAIVAQACEDLGTSTAPLHHEATCLRWLPVTR
jgi:SAM-dependent methyltransferase